MLCQKVETIRSGGCSDGRRGAARQLQKELTPSPGAESTPSPSCPAAEGLQLLALDGGTSTPLQHKDSTARL